jgi:hypothetical protein
VLGHVFANDWLKQPVQFSLADLYASFAGMVPHTDLAKPLLEQIGFSVFNTFQSIERDQFTARNPRGKTGGSWLVPIRQAEEPPCSSDGLFAKAGFDQGASHTVLSGGSHSRSIISEIINLRAVAHAREAHAFGEGHEGRVQIYLASVASEGRVPNEFGIA